MKRSERNGQKKKANKQKPTWWHFLQQEEKHYCFS